MDKGKHIQCTLSTQLWKRVKAYSAQSRVSVTGITELALMAYLDKKDAEKREGKG